MPARHQPDIVPPAVRVPTCLQANAFSSVSTLRLLGGLLAPYCSMLTYSTRLTEMRRLVNDLIAPIAASLAQQKSSQLAKLGCTVEEAPPGSMPADGKGICVAVGSQGRNSSSPVKTLQGSQADGSAGTSSSSSEVVTQPVPVAAISSSGSLKQRKGVYSKGGGAAAANGGRGSSKAGAGTAAAAAAQSSSAHAQSQALSHKRFESGTSSTRQVVVFNLFGWWWVQSADARAQHAPQLEVWSAPAFMLLPCLVGTPQKGLI